MGDTMPSRTLLSKFKSPMSELRNIINGKNEKVKKYAILPLA